VNAQVPVSVLRRINGSRPAVYDGERCEMCGEPIPEGRLEARPWATRCVAHS